MTMSPMLLGTCVCGEPVFRHRRADGRQIACEVLRRIDEQFFQSRPQPVHQPHSQLQIVRSGRDRDRAIVAAGLHGGER